MKHLVFAVLLGLFVSPTAAQNINQVVPPHDGDLTWTTVTCAATSTAFTVGGGQYLTVQVPPTATQTVWFAYPAAGTSTVYGWDIQCDVTKLTRTTGSYCNNTNAAPGSGTLNVAGPVMDQGTGANSWFSMSNPTGLQY